MVTKKRENEEKKKKKKKKKKRKKKREIKQANSLIKCLIRTITTHEVLVHGLDQHLKP